MTTIIALNVSDKTVAAISESKADIRGVSITQQSVRKYNDAEYFAPVIGYTGTISPDQLDKFVQDGEDYIPNDVVGRVVLKNHLNISFLVTEVHRLCSLIVQVKLLMY